MAAVQRRSAAKDEFPRLSAPVSEDRDLRGGEQKLRDPLGVLLTHRRTLERKLLDIENDVRQSLTVFGLMLGPRVQRSSFEARVRALVAHDRLISGVTECMLRA